MTRSISIIAREITMDMITQSLHSKKNLTWQAKYPYAAPYVTAMSTMDKISDPFYLDM
jgi:hypothetical protein